MQELSDEDRATFMRNFNAIPPVTDLQPAKVIVLFRRGETNIMIVLVDGGDCVVGVKPIHLLAFQRLLSSASGHGTKHQSELVV